MRAFLALLIPAATVCGVSATEAAPPQAADLGAILAAFAHHQDQLLSFTDKYRMEERSEARFSDPRTPVGTRAGTWIEEGEFSSDGTRFLHWERDWHEPSMPNATCGTIRNPRVAGYWWDGAKNWCYVGQVAQRPDGTPRGRLTMQANVRGCPKFGPYFFENPRYNFTIRNYHGSRLMGFLLQSLVEDGRRVDEAFKGGGAVRLRPGLQTEPDGSYYVVDAELRGGYLSVWFDPSHQYNAAKAVWTYRRGHTKPGWENMPVKDGGMTYQVTKYAEIDGLSVPMEAVWEVRIGYGNGDYMHKAVRYRRISFTRNPKLEFTENPIFRGLEEGTEIHESACTRDPRTGRHEDRVNATYALRHGQLVPIRGF